MVKGLGFRSFPKSVVLFGRVPILGSIFVFRATFHKNGGSREIQYKGSSYSHSDGYRALL